MVKVLALPEYSGEIEFEKVGRKFRLLKNLNVKLRILKDARPVECRFRFSAGFKTDGLSVPFIFRWFLPNWDEKNMDYNMAGVIHDCLYGNEGFEKFTREECDDIFRGILRECGISRFKAGAADKSVEWFASKHFKTDYETAKFSRVILFTYPEGKAPSSWGM